MDLVKRITRNTGKKKGSSSKAPNPPPPPPTNIPRLPPPLSKHKKRYERIIDRPFTPPRYIVLDDLDSLYVREDVDMMLDRAGLRQFATIREDAYREITLEFLSTFEHDPRERMVTFRLMSQDHTLSIDAFGDLFGFSSSHAGTFARGTSASDFWEAISVGEYGGDKWRPGNSKETSMYNLSFKVVHRILSESLFARTETPQKLKADELFILYCMASTTTPDIATMLADYLGKIANKAKGDICAGGLVTHVARTLGYDFSGCTLAESALPLGSQRLVVRQVLIPRGRGTLHVPMPWHRDPKKKPSEIIWKSEYTIRNTRNWKETFEAMLEELSPPTYYDDDAGDSDEEDEDGGQETMLEFESDTHSGHATDAMDTDRAGPSRTSRQDEETEDDMQPPRHSYAHAPGPRRGRRAPRHFRELVTSFQSLSTDYHTLRTDYDTLSAQFRSYREETDARHSSYDGQMRDMYYHQFGHFYDPSAPMYPYPPPPPPTED